MLKTIKKYAELLIVLGASALALGYTNLTTSGVTGNNFANQINNDFNGTSPVSPQLSPGSTLWGIPLGTTAPSAGTPYLCLANGTITGCSTSSTQPFVFANYLLAFCDFGTCPTNTQAGYEADIAQAMSLGIDAFELNAGLWTNSGGAGYKAAATMFYAAADDYNTNHGTHFKLFMSPDMTGPPTQADVEDMVNSFATDPAQLMYNGKVVFSAFATVLQTVSYWQTVETAVANAGHPIFFLPDMTISPPPTTTTAVTNLYNTWSSVINGMWYFGAEGIPNETFPTWALLPGEENYANAIAALAGNVIYLNPVTPQFWWGNKPGNGRGYWEYYGGMGTANQWQDVISTQNPRATRWVELSTWNDFSESYTVDTTQSQPYVWNTVSTSAFQVLDKYYIQWFKTGIQPTITQDQLLYFYRTMPIATIPSSDPYGNVTETFGPPLDDDFVTTLLTAPATLTINTGGVITTYSLSAGINHTQTPFSAGTQTFSLARGGSTIISVTGALPVVSSAVTLNHFYETGVGSD